MVFQSLLFCCFAGLEASVPRRGPADLHGCAGDWAGRLARSSRTGQQAAWRVHGILVCAVYVAVHTLFCGLVCAYAHVALCCCLLFVLLTEV
jgi:hypothetical protein